MLQQWASRYHLIRKNAALWKDTQCESELQKIIEEYAAQGIHRTGTDVDNAGADWLAEQIQALGVPATTSPFQLRKLTVNVATLTLGTRAIPGVPLYDCDFEQYPTVVTGRPGALGSDAEIGVTMAPPYEQPPPFRAVTAARNAGEHQAIVVITDKRLPETGIALVNAESFRQPTSASTNRGNDSPEWLVAMCRRTRWRHSDAVGDRTLLCLKPT